MITPNIEQDDMFFVKMIWITIIALATIMVLALILLSIIKN